MGGAAGTAALELNPIASTAARVLPSGTPSTVAVPIRTLDDLLEGDPRSIDLLKIDVEGMEAQVLAGAPLTLPRIRRIVVEYEGNAALADLRRILVPAGFTETYCDTYYVYFER